MDYQLSRFAVGLSDKKKVLADMHSLLQDYFALSPELCKKKTGAGLDSFFSGNEQCLEAYTRAVATAKKTHASCTVCSHPLLGVGSVYVEWSLDTTGIICLVYKRAHVLCTLCIEITRTSDIIAAISRGAAKDTLNSLEDLIEHYFLLQANDLSVAQAEQMRTQAKDRGQFLEAYNLAYNLACLLSPLPHTFVLAANLSPAEISPTDLLTRIKKDLRV